MIYEEYENYEIYPEIDIAEIHQKIKDRNGRKRQRNKKNKKYPVRVVYDKLIDNGSDLFGEYKYEYSKNNRGNHLLSIVDGKLIDVPLPTDLVFGAKAKKSLKKSAHKVNRKKINVIAAYNSDFDEPVNGHNTSEYVINNSRGRYYKHHNILSYADLQYDLT